MLFSSKVLQPKKKAKKRGKDREGNRKEKEKRHCVVYLVGLLIRIIITISKKKNKKWLFWFCDILFFFYQGLGKETNLNKT